MKKIIKRFLVFLAVFALMSASVFLNTTVRTCAETPVAVSFDAIVGGTVQYKIGNDGGWTDAADISNLANGVIVYLKAIPDVGKKIDDYQDGGNYTQNLVRYNGSDNYLSLSPVDLLSGNASFTYNSEHSYIVKVSFVDDNSGPGPLARGKYIVNILQEAAGQTGQIKVEFFNGSSSLGSKSYSSSDSSGIDIPENANKVTISITNGSDILSNARLENRTTGKESDLIDDMRNDEENHSATRSINRENAYEIKIEFSNTMNVSWTYDTSDPRKDMIVEHARIELLNSDNATDYKEEGKTNWDLTVGQPYYFVLIPEYGYQVRGLNINGQEIAPMNSVGVFKFVMSHSNFHLQGIVKPFSDSDVAQIQEGGMIGSMSVDGSGVVDSGNVMVKEQDRDPDDQALAVVDSDAEVFGTIDLAVSQAISKGDGNYWETPMTETSKPVKISVVVPAEELSDGETYSIVRNHDGVYEELDAVYDPASETLSFESDKFSEYTIIKKIGEIKKIDEEKSEVKLIDHDTYKSELPSETVIAANTVGAKSFFDLKVHAADGRTKVNQDLLAKYYVGANVKILLTENIYPNRDLSAAENGSLQVLTWVNLPKNQAGPVFGVLYNQTDKAYVINGVLDANGTATFTGFKLRPASTITICK